MADRVRQPYSYLVPSCFKLFKTPALLHLERDGWLSERDGWLSERDGWLSERDGWLSERVGWLSL